MYLKKKKRHGKSDDEKKDLLILNLFRRWFTKKRKKKKSSLELDTSENGSLTLSGLTITKPLSLAQFHVLQIKLGKLKTHLFLGQEART